MDVAAPRIHARVAGNVGMLDAVRCLNIGQRARRDVDDDRAGVRVPGEVCAGLHGDLRDRGPRRLAHVDDLTMCPFAVELHPDAAVDVVRELAAGVSNSTPIGGGGCAWASDGRAMLEEGSGYVVNTASTAGLLLYGFDRLPYTATKHAIVGLSEALALYLRPRGIGVSCPCPAGVATNIVEQITFFGEPTLPKGPTFPVVDPESVGELVAEAVDRGQFLILTAPEVRDELRAHGADMDAYLARCITEKS